MRVLRGIQTKPYNKQMKGKIILVSLNLKVGDEI